MIVRSGLPLSIPVLFTSGHPDGNVTWRLYGTNGALLVSGSVAPLADAVSVNLPIDATSNQLATGVLYGHRDFEWTYTVGAAVVSGVHSYSLEARAPYGVSADGVRAKLGIEKADLPDSDISLIRGYFKFRDTIGEAALIAVTDPAKLMTIRDAIEAQVALLMIPTMAVRIAASEDTGTNSYKRQLVDWAAIAEALSVLISDGLTAVDPLYDPMTGVGALFLLATPTSDPITGGTYTV